MLPSDIDAVTGFEDVGKSSKFALSAPISPSEATILIVDDDPVVRMVMQDSLEEEGFSVWEAKDGIDACQRCSEAIPSLVVVDAVMPKMDGFSLCRELRREPATQHVPILMATSLDDHGSITRAYEAGATDFIAKPLNWIILTQRIRYMLRGARVFEDLRSHQQRLSVAQAVERAQGNRLEVALRNMSQGLCMVGADGRIELFNQRFCDIYRLSLDLIVPGILMIDVLTRSPVFSGASDEVSRFSLAEHLALTGHRASAGRKLALPDGRVILNNLEPAPGGGFVFTFTELASSHSP
jgi:CheY-like chemotaxis protein